MRKSNWTPSIVPRGDDQNVYLVADDLGKVGGCWREADYETTDLETVIQDLLRGNIGPIRVIGFNTSEGWSQDVSEDAAHELRTIGQNVTFTVLALPGRTLSARVNYVFTAIDPASRRLLVRAAVDNTNAVLKRKCLPT